MIRRIVAIWVSLAMLFGFVVIVDVVTDITPTVRATTLYVNETGSGGAYTSIQDAINAANDADTVFVYSGTYTESLVIDKTINLTGEDRSTTVIKRFVGFVQFVIYINASNVNVSGFTITESGANDAGIRFDNVQNCVIYDNNIISNNGDGLYFEMSSYNKIINNYISNNGILNRNACGIYLSLSSNNNIVTGNEISDNVYGIYTYASINNNITDNNFINDGIFIWGDQLSHFNSHNIPENNLVNGKPIYYYKNTSGIDLDAAPFGELIIVNCTDFTIKNSQITNTDVGIEIAYSTNCTISGNRISSIGMYGMFLDSSSGIDISANIISDNDGAIMLISSSHNTIINNYINRSYDYAFYLGTSSFNLFKNNYIDYSTKYGFAIYWYSDNNTFINNDILNTDFGTWFSRSSNNSFFENYLYNNDFGILISGDSNNITSNEILGGNDLGIELRDTNHTIAKNNISMNLYGIKVKYSSQYNMIKNNNISNNYFGISMSKEFSTIPNNNTIIYNNIYSNTNYGIVSGGAMDNKIYHNNIIENAIQATDSGYNFWDNGYPLGGNYWSDFDEPGEGAYDDYKGPNQNITGKDGIIDNGTIAGGGKNPYVIDADSWDNYPLISSIGNYLYLHPGWNHISLPYIQSSTNLDSVLSTIANAYDAVQWYNATNSLDHWKHFNKVKPSSSNDLHELDHTMGFWIHITEPGGVLFEYLGNQPAVNQTIQLYPGWNQVGYPSNTNYNRTYGLNNIIFGTDVDALWTFNAATQTWEEIGLTDYFELGRGYWIHSKVTKIWDVPL